MVRNHHQSENHHQKDGLRKSHGAAPPETQTAKKTPHVLAGTDPAADPIQPSQRYQRYESAAGENSGASNRWICRL